MAYQLSSRDRALVVNAQDHIEDMINPRLVEVRQAIADAEIAGKYERYYREAGPMHLSPEICAAIERDLDRRAQQRP